MSHFSTYIIANPKSCGGRTQWLARRLEALVAAELQGVKIVWTQKPREATELARRALKSGNFEQIVAGGGDGTVNEVVNGFFEDANGKLIRDDAVLGVLPMGSGQDFVRSLGWKPFLKPAVKRLTGKKVRPCDVGLMHYKSIGGATVPHYFINIADVGLGPEVMRRVNAFPKYFGPQLAYVQGMLRTLLTYKRRYVELLIDDCHHGSQLITNILIANGRSNGGGWQFCPEAQLDDGLFDILVVGNVGITEFFRALPKLYRGARFEHPELSYYRGKTIKVLEAESEHVRVEADGEPLGYIPAEFTNLHHKIRIKV